MKIPSPLLPSMVKMMVSRTVIALQIAGRSGGFGTFAFPAAYRLPIPGAVRDILHDDQYMLIVGACDASRERPEASGAFVVTENYALVYVPQGLGCTMLYKAFRENARDSLDIVRSVLAGRYAAAVTEWPLTRFDAVVPRLLAAYPESEVRR